MQEIRFQDVAMVDEKKELAQTAKLFEYMAQFQKTIKITPVVIKKGKMIERILATRPHSYNSKALKHLAATTTINVSIKLTPREVTNAKAAVGTMSLTTLFAAAPAKTKVDNYNNPADVSPGKEES